MLQLQLKHFGKEAKQSFKKVSFQHMQQKNIQMESAKQAEYQVNEISTTRIKKDNKYWHDVGSYMDKISEMDLNRPKKELKTISVYRQPAPPEYF